MDTGKLVATSASPHAVPPTLQPLTVDTIGQAWLAAAETVLVFGQTSSWRGAPIQEFLQLLLVVSQPSADDDIVDRFGDADRLRWMHANFHDHSRVPELGDADSYATRLYDYARSGRDQLAWVVDRLRNDPSTRNATITTFQPLTDTTYIPCVSLLDFWIDDQRLQLGIYAHGIDFGTKGYANLVELAYIQKLVAGRLDVAVGNLTLMIKSAHVYENDVHAMRATVASATAGLADLTSPDQSVTGQDRAPHRRLR